MKRSAGLTIIEFMIVVAVLAVIIAIAIPSFINARKASAESSAKTRLRSTVTLSEQYRGRFGTYANGLPAMITSGLTPDYDTNPASAYIFTYSGSSFTWAMNGNPRFPGNTGDNYFYADQTGVIRFSPIGPADANSQPIE
jgi:type IV pilus assembly protein PilE